MQKNGQDMQLLYSWQELRKKFEFDGKGHSKDNLCVRTLITHIYISFKYFSAPCDLPIRDKMFFIEVLIIPPML